jgi:uncharacterized protein (TIGR03118 family)
LQMRSITNRVNRCRASRHSVLLLTLVGCASHLSAQNNYFVHNLASDLPAVADQEDNELINPWDFTPLNVCLPVGFPECQPPDVSSVLILSNGANLVAQYSPIPGAVEAKSYPYKFFGVAGVMGLYALPEPDTAKLADGLLFCTNNGTIVGLGIFAPTFVTTLVDNSKSGAIYTGCSSGNPFLGAGAPFYYAANFGKGTIDVWDSNLNALRASGGFLDPVIPPGFSPFNIQGIGPSVLLVTYARRDQGNKNDVPGSGNGYIAAFDYNGSLLGTLVAGGHLNSPWGFTIAPATFGDFANALLVANAGDGRINAFDLVTGAWKGTLADTEGNPISIPGLHALHFGGGDATGDTTTLYFTAGIGGPNGEPLGSHGLFGSIQAPPTFGAGAVVNGADFSLNLAPNTWATIAGGSLAPKTRPWNSADFVDGGLPAKLDGVGVTVNGKPGFASYISPTQVNFLVPADLTPGTAEIRTTNNGLTSPPISITLTGAAPAFFFLPGETDDHNFIAALKSDNSPAVIVAPGEAVALFGTGFGPTTPTPPNGELINSPLPLTQLPQVTIGTLSAEVTFAGLVGPGLYQVNVVIPNIDPKYRFFGVPVTMSIAGAATQASGYLGF